MSLWLRPWRMLSRQALGERLAQRALPTCDAAAGHTGGAAAVGAAHTASHAAAVAMVWRLPGGSDAGWPLAIPALVAVGGIAAGLSPSLDLADAVGTIAWQGVVPATLALALGAVIRRLIAHSPFVHVLGRGLLPARPCACFWQTCWASGVDIRLPGVEGDLSLVARWAHGLGRRVRHGAC